MRWDQPMRIEPALTEHYLDESESRRRIEQQEEGEYRKDMAISLGILGLLLIGILYLLFME